MQATHQGMLVPPPARWSRRAMVCLNPSDTANRCSAPAWRAQDVGRLRSHQGLLWRVKQSKGAARRHAPSGLVCLSQALGGVGIRGLHGGRGDD